MTTIGEAAERSGMPAKTIRYYEEIGLIGPATRAENGYRSYDDTDVHTLRFVKRARGLGFSIRDCQELLSMYRDRNRASADVKALATARIEEIDRKMAELAGMRSTLATLAEKCHGDDRPDCPILDDLASGQGTRSTR